jgi:hypothetical protein
MTPLAPDGLVDLVPHLGLARAAGAVLLVTLLLAMIQRELMREAGPGLRGAAPLLTVVVLPLLAAFIFIAASLGAGLF